MDAWELLDCLEEIRREIPRDAAEPEAREIRRHLDGAVYACRRAIDRLRAERRAMDEWLETQRELPVLPPVMIRVTTSAAAD